MFSGIIEDLGAVSSVKRSDKGVILTIRTRIPLGRIKVGHSIAVSGVCLTVTARGRGTITMDVSAETLRCSVLGRLKPGDPVNLERCLTLGTLVGGHLVAGHVDDVGRIVSIRPEGDSRLYTFEASRKDARYLVEKGSVAVDGVSLTVFGIRRRNFTCALIPYTLKMTTLGVKGPGTAVNIECDMLGKYVEKFMTERSRRNGGAAIR